VTESFRPTGRRVTASARASNNGTAAVLRRRDPTKVVEAGRAFSSHPGFPETKFSCVLSSSEHSWLNFECAQLGADGAKKCRST
jgi:hypothetical protein